MNKNDRISSRKVLLYIIFLLYIFHFRVYFYLGIACPLSVEIFIVLVLFLALKYSMRPIIEGIKYYMERQFHAFNDEMILLISIVILFIGLGYIYGIEFIENIIFYNKVEKKYGMVYSYELVNKSYLNKSGYRSVVRSMSDTTKRSSFRANINSKCLISYPKLKHHGEYGYKSIYHKNIFEDNPTDIQIEYCKEGAKLSGKIGNLRYSGSISKEDLLTYFSNIHSHDNRIISAEIEKRGEKYIFVNALQSENKLWALKYFDVEDGKHVLLMYDKNNPSLFTIVDQNPTNEDYDYYNTKEGRVPELKYLLLIELAAQSMSSVEKKKILM